ncbi:uncharacterized protein CLUP02_10062 [Colletotrichum lupini]|uniref:Uncharacterized protein n=1 Tax=Colletotrichum lupini TaxID=145971 RepID=A0A9Q8SWT8_9PEZI|nr:uncharacterized protein CLUP02_10062 [Colletotrichum lupini]UQC84565.1 hypothetical protein CLUP02_10062 [Colletotrichum lupini]
MARKWGASLYHIGGDVSEVPSSADGGREGHNAGRRMASNMVYHLTNSRIASRHVVSPIGLMSIRGRQVYALPWTNGHLHYQVV